MRPSTLLRSLSTNIQSRLSPSPVTPWPPPRSTFDRWLTAELKELRAADSHHCEIYTTATWHIKALQIAAAAQKPATCPTALANGDPKMIDDYLDDNAELLDACNVLRERFQSIREYIANLRAVLRVLDGANYNRLCRRAMVALDSCLAMERRCIKLGSWCGSNLRKLGQKISISSEASINGGEEALTGSRAVALLVLGALTVSLSFKSKRTPPVILKASRTSSWMNSLFEISKDVKDEFEKGRITGVAGLKELRRTAATVAKVRSLIAGGEVCRSSELESAVEELRSRYEELRETVEVISEKVNVLYRELVSVRMWFLGLGLRGKALKLV